MIALLEELVQIESPSSDALAVAKLGARIAREFERIGGQTTFHPGGDFAPHLQVQFEQFDFGGGDGKSAPVLLLGHMDTVYDIGTLQRMPWRIEKGRAYGPGVFDMKGGIVQILFAIHALQQTTGRFPRPVRVLLVSDEEVGSRNSRPLTERLAKGCAAALVCEPSLGPKGALKTWRKGVGEYRVRVTGKAAHAGIDFEKGASAIVELAAQVGKVAAFTDPRRGTTVNPGTIRGGTSGNVVAEESEVVVDVRVVKSEDAARLDKKFQALKARDRMCSLAVTGGMTRPPMERNAATVALFRKAQRVAKEVGFSVGETGTGGGSDGNFTSAMGIPTLDGLGCVGDGAHSLREHVVIAELPRRAALLAGLIAKI